MGYGRCAGVRPFPGVGETTLLMLICCSYGMATDIAMARGHRKEIIHSLLHKNNGTILRNHETIITKLKSMLTVNTNSADEPKQIRWDQITGLLVCFGTSVFVVQCSLQGVLGGSYGVFRWLEATRALYTLLNKPASQIAAVSPCRESDVEVAVDASRSCDIISVAGAIDP